MTTRTAGRELDARIAEMVMGWRWRQGEKMGYANRMESVEYIGPDSLPLGVLQRWEQLPDGRWAVNLPRFKEHIAFAWWVVEAMRDRGWACAIDCEGSPEGPLYGVTFVHFWTSTAADASADIAPEAICMAAVRALEART